MNGERLFYLENINAKRYEMNHLKGVNFSFDALSDYSDDELETFKLFKKYALEKYPQASSLDDGTLRRFLDADRSKKKFDVDASISRLSDTLEWRKKHDVDNVRKRKIARLNIYRKLRVRQFFGVDNAGRPVQFERLGDFFNCTNASTMVLSERDWAECYTWDIEGIFEEMRKSALSCKKMIDKYVYVADLQHFSFSCSASFLKHGVPLLRKLSGEIERFYPEIAGPIILINAPYVVSGLYSVCKVFLDPVTAAKIEIHSGVPMERLLKIMPASCIPKEFGGTSPIELRRCVPYQEISIDEKSEVDTASKSA